jgi:folate-dependent phosphoribosylglycinamide formyltransferase PurN
LTARIHKAEHIAFPKALRLVASEYVKLGDNGDAIFV